MTAISGWFAESVGTCQVTIQNLFLRQAFRSLAGFVVTRDLQHTRYPIRLKGQNSSWGVRIITAACKIENFDYHLAPQTRRVPEAIPSAEYPAAIQKDPADSQRTRSVAATFGFNFRLRAGPPPLRHTLLLIPARG